MTAVEPELKVDPELKKELHATVQVRKELGAEYEDALIDSFLAKLGRRAGPLAEQRPHPGRAPAPQHRDGGRRGLAFFSLIVAVPLTAIGAGTAGLRGMLLVW